MKTLDQRLEEVLSQLEKTYNIKLSPNDRKRFIENKSVGYSKDNTFDKVVEQLNFEVQSLANQVA